MARSSAVPNAKGEEGQEIQVATLTPGKRKGKKNKWRPLFQKKEGTRSTHGAPYPKKKGGAKSTSGALTAVRRTSKTSNLVAPQTLQERRGKKYKRQEYKRQE